MHKNYVISTEFDCGEIQNKLHFYNIGTHLLVEVVYIVVFYIPLQQQNILDRLAG